MSRGTDVRDEREFVEIADSEAVTQIRDDWAVFKISSIRVLDKAPCVAVGIAQVLSESISRQKIETVGEALVQRGLEGVVKHLQLRIINGRTAVMFGCWLKYLRPKSKYSYSDRAAEICVEESATAGSDRWLRDSKDGSASSDVADLSYEVVLELILDAQVHSMMRGMMRFGPVVFTGPLMLTASPTGRVVGKPVEISWPLEGNAPEL